MPPKAKPVAPSKKTETKKKEKVIEDKTFGLKNKKGAKQQKFIQQVEKQVKSGGIHVSRPTEDKKAEKEKKLKEQKELAQLFKPVQNQKIDKGTDPKSVVCTLFKQGLCTRGDKCKFSHDLTVERKAEKRSLYVDMRDDEEGTMDNWDEEKLKEVVEKKHGESANKVMPTTNVICKHFIDAVEKAKYGWFWECPSGTKCIYRHALPPGFVLKKDKKKMDEKRSEISLVDLIERERAALGSNQTKITLETFIAWKKRKLLEKQESIAREEEQKRQDYRAGRAAGLSGREMFSFDPRLVNDADDDDGEAFDTAQFRNSEEREDDVEYREVELDIIAMEATENDGSGTQATDNRLTNNLTNGNTGDSDSSPSKDNTEGSTPPPGDDTGGTGPINENLFLDDELDEELENLDLND